MKFQKMRDFRSASSRFVASEELLAALFSDLPELQHFKFVKTQEYDDNNYFDDIRIVEVNGHPYGHDGYDEEEQDEKSDLPRIEVVSLIESAVDHISDDYDFSEDEVEIRREDYKGDGPKRDRYDLAERRYWAAYMSGGKLPKSFFVKNHPKWAVYYSMDHGRFDKETEFKIFARKGRMFEALHYAEVVGRLSQEVENFFILDADEGDSGVLKTYLEKFVRSEKCA